jgi:hypothetical protein
LEEDGTSPAQGEGTKKCVHMYVNVKILPVETILGIEGGQNKGEWWRE